MNWYTFRGSSSIIFFFIFILKGNKLLKERVCSSRSRFFPLRVYFILEGSFLSRLYLCTERAIALPPVLAVALASVWALAKYYSSYISVFHVKGKAVFHNDRQAIVYRSCLTKEAVRIFLYRNSRKMRCTIAL